MAVWYRCSDEAACTRTISSASRGRGPRLADLEALVARRPRALVDERPPHRSARRDPSRAPGGELAPDTDDFRVMRAKIAVLLAEDPSPCAWRPPGRWRLCRPSTYGQAVHACPPRRRASAVLRITRPVAGRGHDRGPTYGVDSARRSASTWRQSPSVGLEGVPHLLGAHPAGRERDCGDAVGA